MNVETLNAKFATLIDAYAARDADQAAMDAGVVLVNAAVAPSLATYLAANTQARSDANMPALESAVRTSSAAASAALADYADAFEEFKNQ